MMVGNFCAENPHCCFPIHGQCRVVESKTSYNRSKPASHRCSGTVIFMVAVASAFTLQQRQKLCKHW
eukprot:m.1204575 g.1204575  ORF g.1204575 m.1204575 type:complete len:67 (-) comp24580_c1_seq22:88-288(-)